MFRGRFGGYRPYLQCAIPAVIAGCALLGAPAPPAHAESCEAHLAKHATAKAVDIEYHRMYGGKSPCQDGYKPGDEVHTDEPMKQTKGSDSGYDDEYRRDRLGYGCTVFGCG